MRAWKAKLLAGAVLTTAFTVTGSTADSINGETKTTLQSLFQIMASNELGVVTVDESATTDVQSGEPEVGTSLQVVNSFDKSQEDSGNVISEFYGDKEMLEGAEGHITALSDSATPYFEYIFGAPVQISIDPAKPYTAIIVPEEVSVDTQSTIRVIAGNESIDHSFTVVNQAEPEQVSGKTVAQCTFYHDYNGYAGVAGTGHFSFDKRTVNNFFIGADELSYPPIKQIISTTRAIDGISLATGLTAFDKNGNARITQGLGNLRGEGIWYAGSGHHAGKIHSPRRGAGFYLDDNHWTTRDLKEIPHGDEHTDIWFSGENNYAEDSAARGRWAVEFPNPPVAYSEGYFECTLTDENSSTAGPESTADSASIGDASESNPEDISVQSDQGSPASGGGSLGYLIIALADLMQVVRCRAG